MDMESVSEEKLLSYLVFLEKICHGLPVDLNKYIQKMRNMEVTQSAFMKSFNKLDELTETEQSQRFPELLENLYACSFKQIQPTNDILDILKSTYAGIIERVDFSLDTSKLLQIGFSNEEIAENRDKQTESGTSVLTRRGRRAKNRAVQTENIVDYTFYKDDNFNLDLIEDDSDDEFQNKAETPSTNSQTNVTTKRKRGQPLVSNSNTPSSNPINTLAANNNATKPIGKKKRGKYNTASSANNANPTTTSQSTLGRIKEEGEPTYCFCKQVSFGGMVACDSDKCPYQWFHYSCVGLSVAPEGVWYCSECREKRN